MAKPNAKLLKAVTSIITALLLVMTGYCIYTVASQSEFISSLFAEPVEEDCGDIFLLVGDSTNHIDGCISENEEIVTCNEGILIAQSPGKVRVIFEESRKYKKYWDVIVSDYSQTIVPMGKTVQLEAVDPDCEWLCSNSEIASVENDGLVTPVTVGDCVIRATSPDGKIRGWKISVKRTAYLTIDDWPNNNTLLILDILEKYNIKATFFVVGQKNHHDVYRKIIEAGHTIGNHTRSHDIEYIYQDASNMVHSVELMDKWLNEKFGVTTKLLRYPGGYTKRNYAYSKSYRLLTEQGYKIFDWTCVVDDINYTEREDILNSFYTSLNSDVEIILMHNNKSTADVLDEVIQHLIKNDYVCLPLDESCATYDFIHGWQE